MMMTDEMSHVYNFDLLLKIEMTTPITNPFAFTHKSPTTKNAGPVHKAGGPMVIGGNKDKH